LRSHGFNTVFIRALHGPYPEPCQSNPHHPILSLLSSHLHLLTFDKGTFKC
jgi:hypothetical protein